MDKYFWVPTNSAVLSAFFMPAAIFIGVPTAETFFPVQPLASIFISTGPEEKKISSNNLISTFLPFVLLPWAFVNTKLYFAASSLSACIWCLLLFILDPFEGN